MANHKASEGTVKVASNVVAEIRSYSLNESAPTIDDTEIGDTARTKKAGAVEASGSMECWWDETDTTGQGAMTVGSEVTLNIFPEGDSSGDTYETMSAIITGKEITGSEGGMVEAKIDFEVNGAVTETTVT